MSKGSNRRPSDVDGETFAENWRRIFDDDNPQCGKDFCDECGDCLACYGGDPCTDGGEHVWIKRGDS